MNIKQRILKHLIGNKEKTFSILEIARALKTDYKLVYTNVHKLMKEGTVTVEDLGNTKRCSFSALFNEDVFIVERERKKELLKNKDFLVMYDRIYKIHKQFILLMFGSQIKGTAMKHSDIDLLLIANEEEAKEVENAINLLPYKLHLTHVLYEDFIRMLKSKEFTVVSEAIKKNVILVGIEDFYRFIEDAG